MDKIERASINSKGNLTSVLNFDTLVALKSPLHGIMKEVVEAIT